MSGEDQRNTLITELAGRTRDSGRFFQSLNDADLAGAGALLVYLREGRRRTDAEIQSMSADDMRNTVIVEVAAQTQRGSDLQGLTNLELVRLGMGPERSFIRGVLLVGKFRSQVELNAMSGEDQRNTLITELAGRTRDNASFYHGLNNAELAGAGALLVYLRGVGSRTDAQIRTITADDMRNTVIVELHAQTRRSDLQGLTNMQLALTALGSRELRDVSNLPERLRPGRHVLTLRVDRSALQNTTRSFSDVPVIGTFIRRGTDCTHGFQMAPGPAGFGASFEAVVGWGQVQGDGHPDSNSDQCLSWVSRLSLDFDARDFVSIPVKTLVQAVLSVREQEAGGCITMVYTQGDF